MTEQQVLPVLLRGYDDAWERLSRRLEGLAGDEYLWEPTRDAWSVRRDDAGRWTADGADPDPDPAPVTTIAWRVWHLASDCLADYLDRSPGGRPLPTTGRQRHGSPEPALRNLRTAAEAFRAAMTDLGEDGIWVGSGRRGARTRRPAGRTCWCTPPTSWPTTARRSPCSAICTGGAIRPPGGNRAPPRSPRPAHPAPSAAGPLPSPQRAGRHRRTPR